MKVEAIRTRIERGAAQAERAAAAIPVGRFRADSERAKKGVDDVDFEKIKREIRGLLHSILERKRRRKEKGKGNQQKGRHSPNKTILTSGRFFPICVILTLAVHIMWVDKQRSGTDGDLRQFAFPCGASALADSVWRIDTPSPPRQMVFPACDDGAIDTPKLRGCDLVSNWRFFRTVQGFTDTNFFC